MGRENVQKKRLKKANIGPVAVLWQITLGCGRYNSDFSSTIGSDIGYGKSAGNNTRTEAGSD